MKILFFLHVKERVEGIIDLFKKLKEEKEKVGDFE